MKLLKINFAAGWLLVLATLGLVAFFVPAEDKTLGKNYLIFFYHFPSAISCLLFFLASGIASIAYLADRSAKYDQAALAAVEVGVLACTITMVTGSIWAKAAWGVFWVWDDKRLLTVAIMWFTYLAYLALRATIESPSQRSRFAAIFGIMAMANIPLVWFSIRIFGSVRHPMQISVEPPMRITMWFGALAFLVLYIALWRQRLAIARLRDETAALEEGFIARGM